MSTEIFKMEDVNLQAKKNRVRAYREETDTLFFKAQRGELDIEEWKAAVAEVKARFPYVTEDVVINLNE